VSYAHLATVPAAAMLRTAMRRRGLADWDRRSLTQAEALAALDTPPPTPPTNPAELPPASLDELAATLERLSRSPSRSASASDRAGRKERS
jgi:hypothetical protein